MTPYQLLNKIKLLFFKLSASPAPPDHTSEQLCIMRLSWQALLLSFSLLHTRVLWLNNNTRAINLWLLRRLKYGFCSLLCEITTLYDHRRWSFDKFFISLHLSCKSRWTTSANYALKASIKVLWVTRINNQKGDCVKCCWTV